MVKVLPALMVAAALLAGGCTGFNPPPRPAVVTHLDVTQKQAYIRSTESALKSFRAVAADLRSSHNLQAQADLRKEVNSFVKLRVEPIVDDFEASHHPETRLQVAELQLLSGQVYLALEQYWDAWLLLRDMQRRYGDQPALLNAGIDRQEFGYSNLGDGMRGLHKALWR